VRPRSAVREPERSGATVSVGVGEDAYPVIIRGGALRELPTLLSERVGARRYAIVTDDNVEPLHARELQRLCGAHGLDAEVFAFPAGEASKTRATWASLTDRLLAAEFGRDGCVVAVGGGVTTDVGGFVAATYMRGLPVVQVPTSYLAMIDASVGGKTGVDTPHGKNLVGAFHPPALVVADTEVLVTLPRAERAQGLVEAFKHGAILDRSYFDELARSAQALLDAEPEAAAGAVTRSVELKARVVTEDERESGLRQILNFGHTAGHAIEAAAGFSLGHGSAVALGMMIEARLGERLGVTLEGTSEALGTALAPLAIGPGPVPAVESVMPFLRLDKKVRSGRPRFVLLRRIGETDPGDGWTSEVPDHAVEASFRDFVG